MSYAPQESPQDLWTERSYFVGGFLAAVAYGFHCCIYGTTVYCLLRHPSRGNRPPDYKLISFVSVIWAIATINLAAGTQWTMMMFIDDRNYPGGPVGFLYGEFSHWIDTFGGTSYVINNCLTDLLVLHRTFVVWGHNYWVVVIPFLAIVTSTILSLFTLVQSALPSANIWTHITFSFAVPYWGLSIPISALPTLLIVFRLLFVRNSLRSALGEEHAKTYTSLIAIIVESAAVYAVVCLIFFIAFWRNSNIQNLALPIMGQFMCIPSELIIVRVALGRAFTRETAAIVSSVRFRTSPTLPTTMDTTRRADTAEFTASGNATTS